MKRIRYEDSPADKRADKRGARKAGMTMAQWEKSAADKKADAAARAKLRRKRKK
jgi:hypothetical protein